MGPYHGGVQVLNRKGELVDIDGGSLRALLDDRFARRIAAEVDAASRQVGERLKRHRVRLRVTQVQLAERSGLDQAIISRLERGRHQPRWDALERYARGLGITTENLLSSQA
ncbi:MAG TPA: helix-turn-helix transcriptional regulator [Longimicrobium sp.]|nr:helix-turn-helix transcriptional regulator [Longimicrobium sp.]